MRTILHTPPIPRIVPDGVFDAFAWCESEVLEWEGPAEITPAGALTADNPARMVFVFRRDLAFLPRELASMHTPRLDVGDAWALAPYGIDDATDELFAHGVPPGEALYLATDSLAGLFWGLHDWAHFHNHGPFTQRAWTELQCDASALAWLWLNREALRLPEATWEAVRGDASRIGAARFADEGLDPLHARLDAARVRGWVGPG